MNCKSVESRLSAYLDGELSGQEMFALRDHLNQCESCRCEAASLKSLKRMIGCMNCPEPTADFEARLLRAVATRTRPRVAYSVYQSIFVFAGVAGMTMLLMLQFLGNRASTQLSHPNPSTTISNTGADFEVRRNEMTSAISDPISGAPVWSATNSR